VDFVDIRISTDLVDVDWVIGGLNAGSVDMDMDLDAHRHQNWVSRSWKKSLHFIAKATSNNQSIHSARLIYVTNSNWLLSEYR
jgi:hypothetical protein